MLNSDSCLQAQDSGNVLSDLIPTQLIIPVKPVNEANRYLCNRITYRLS
jgi:hypothetical protein